MVHTQCEQTAECSIDVSNDEVHRLCGMKSGKRNSIFPFKHTHTHISTRKESNEKRLDLEPKFELVQLT